MPYDVRGAVFHGNAIRPIHVIPAEDGGYVLIGLARPVASLFHDIAWGSDRVMAQSRERLRAAGVRWRELAPSWDVDRPEDLARLRASGIMSEALRAIG